MLLDADADASIACVLHNLVTMRELVSIWCKSAASHMYANLLAYAVEVCRLEEKHSCRIVLLWGDCQGAATMTYASRLACIAMSSWHGMHHQAAARSDPDSKGPCPLSKEFGRHPSWNKPT